MTPKPESETDPWKAAEDAVYDPFCEAEEAWGIVDAARAAEAAQHQQALRAGDAEIEACKREIARLTQEPFRLAQVLSEARARVAAVEAERDALERLRVHCEHCGADYAATGVEAGCPCLVRAERDRLKAALSQITALDFEKFNGRHNFYSGAAMFVKAWLLAYAALTPQGQSTDGETR